MPKKIATKYAIDDVWRTLTHAVACDEIWWLLEGTHTERTTIIKASNRHLDFFLTLRPSMFVTCVVLLSTLFDERADCITLKSIPELQSDSEFDGIWKKGRRLYRYRSKAIAHRDTKNDTIDFAQKTGFTYGSLRSLLTDVCDLYDRFAKSNNLPSVRGHKLKAADELFKIMGSITKGD